MYCAASLGAFWDALLLQPLTLGDEMFEDLRYGARLSLKHKGFTVVAVLSLSRLALALIQPSSASLMRCYCAPWRFVIQTGWSRYWKPTRSEGSIG